MNQTFDTIWTSALRKLDLRLHSKKELADKLNRSFPEEKELVLKVLEELERVHLLNDQQYTEQLITHLTQKNCGRFKIILEIRKRGINEAVAESIIQSSDWSEQAAAKRAIEEKERSLSGLNPQKKKQKLANFLKGRGFSTGIIYSLLND